MKFVLYADDVHSLYGDWLWQVQILYLETPRRKNNFVLNLRPYFEPYILKHFNIHGQTVLEIKRSNAFGIYLSAPVLSESTCDNGYSHESTLNVRCIRRRNVSDLRLHPWGTPSTCHVGHLALLVGTWPI